MGASDTWGCKPINPWESWFWTHLEMRVCDELRGMSELQYRFLWCDGFEPQRYEFDEGPPRVEGRAAIGGYAGDAASLASFGWTFCVLLPRDVKDRDAVDWASLLPPDEATGWLGVDRERLHLEIEVGVGWGEVG